MLTPERRKEIGSLTWRETAPICMEVIGELLAEIELLTPPPAALNADRTYEDVCRRECGLCRDNVYGGAIRGMSYHYSDGDLAKGTPRECKAPSERKLIERLLKERKNG